MPGQGKVLVEMRILGLVRRAAFALGIVVEWEGGWCVAGSYSLSCYRTWRWMEGVWMKWRTWGKGEV